MEARSVNGTPVNGGQVLTKRLRLAALQKRAARLGARIDRMDTDEFDREIDKGRYRLVHAGCSKPYHIWVTGLPLAGIAEALDCFERELALPPEADIGLAWADFGSWMRG